MSRQIVHQGRKIKLALDTEIDSLGRELIRDVILHPGAAAILPIVDPENVVLLRNHRPVVGETLWEIPAGTLEPGEDPALAAIRELSEETGYHASDWRKLAEFYPSPGVMNEKIHLYLAKNLTPGSMHLEADESIEPRIVQITQAFEWIHEGIIRDAKTILALFLWQSKLQ